MPLNNEEKPPSQKQDDPRAKILNEIKSRVTNNHNNLTFDDALFELWTLIGGYGDMVGREFDIIYKDNKIVKIIQKPIRTKVLVNLFDLFKKYNQRQEKMYKKNQPQGVGRK